MITKHDHNSYDDVMASLSSLAKRKGIHYGLNGFKKVLSRLQNPHQFACPIIHIAGTNGKGSTAAYLKSGLEYFGHRVGVYTSPHLHDYTERFYVSNRLISKEEFVHYFKKTLPYEDELTEFERLTLMAFLWFQEQTPDFLILETGLGGRLDATNVVDSTLSVITSIGLDHQELLGPKLQDIALEKAGIMNRHVVLSSDLSADMRTFLHQIAQSNQVKVTQAEAYQGSLAPFLLNAPYQRGNIGLAMESLRVLGQEVPVQALYKAKNPGRFDCYKVNGHLVILDCAHNPEGIRVLAESIRLCFPDQVFQVVVGMLKRKYQEGILAPLKAISEVLWLCDFLPPDSLILEEYERYQGSYVDIQGPTIFTGSIYFIDQVHLAIEKKGDQK